MFFIAHVIKLFVVIDVLTAKDLIICITTKDLVLDVDST